MMRPRYNVLFLSSWYPSRINPFNGIFIKRHAETVARFCTVGVLCAIPDPNLRSPYELECSQEGRIFAVRAYYKIGKRRWPSADLGLIRLIKITVAYYLGFTVIKERLGQPDLAHVNVGYPSGFFALLLKKTRGLNYLITEHSAEYTKEDGTYNKWPIQIRLLIGMIFKDAAVVTAPSRYLIDALRKNGVGRRFAVIPNVIDFPKRIMRRRPRGRVIALTVALLRDRDKNISGLIRAISKASQKRRNLELHIVGDGEDRRKLEALARSLEMLGRSVYFHGAVPPEETSRFFASSNFFVLNSRYETFSVTTAEALANGLPVISTRCGGPEEFVTKETGLLIDKEDEAMLIQAIEQMCENSSRYNSNLIRKYARKVFDSKRIGLSFYSIYRKVVSE